MFRPISWALAWVFLFLVLFCARQPDGAGRPFNSSYSGHHLDRIAFPIGGIGAGMVCLEGTGTLSHVSVRHKLERNKEPVAFAALCVKGEGGNTAKVLEGQVPEWKIFGKREAGNGLGETSYGLPRFREASFESRFPFASVRLSDPEIPLEVTLTGWSPFIPGDADHSSLPVGALEYSFQNTSRGSVEAVFSFNSQNFMRIDQPQNDRLESIKPMRNGFVLTQAGTVKNPEFQGEFAFYTDDPATVVDHCWFRGGWFDPLTIAWKNIREALLTDHPPVEGRAPGASLFVPFELKPGESKTVRLMLAWYVPQTVIRIGEDPANPEPCACSGTCAVSKTHVPWYAGRFGSIREVVDYWLSNVDGLRKSSAAFSEALFASTLTPEVMEAVSANLSILKSPTVFRQSDGRLWNFEGCGEDWGGCCHGSCTHVWNYAQATAHLFPELERTLRETEFFVSQDKKGHQQFRSNLPIRPVLHNFYAAADGQLGGIMKVHREWRISGDNAWMAKLWPKVRESLEYCSRTWDPRDRGVLEEPHHNTYDIEFWGPNGFSTSFYLGALEAAVRMGKALGEDVSRYEGLLAKGKALMDSDLYNGEYYIQKVRWEGLSAPNPVELAKGKWNVEYSPEALELLKKEGPKYQYGNGCLSDGVLGFWLARMCGIGETLADPAKVKSHLKSVHAFNLKGDLLDHVNTQRPSFGMGKDGGLLLCTWPKQDALTLPFPYSNEVWTGIEYQVASHMMLEGFVGEGLDVVRAARRRYDGRVRNPFNEYECGHWYGRALSSWGLLQALTGVRYDAVEKILYMDSKIGDDFSVFLSTNTGFGLAGLKGGKPFLDVRSGSIAVQRVMVSGREMAL
ncbi:hypothetical protein JW906_11555 [bacterium]|nr:hypothetical protein [bacterium]